MMKAYFQKRILKFNQPAGTSRGILLEKPSWYIYLYDEDSPEYKGIGEVSVIPGLSLDNIPEIENKLADLCKQINAGTYNFEKSLVDFPAINFGLETALKDYNVKGNKLLYPSKFTKGEMGIRTNGLVWMGNLEAMTDRVQEKITKGFKCIKIKIGAIDLRQEITILSNLRRKFSPDELEIRVDANGAFRPEEVTDVLKQLFDLGVHSIEQPIIKGQIDKMAEICANSPLPIALDEELIGIHPWENKRKLIELIRPKYIVLKPGLLGGVKASTDWINIADEFGIGWWVTSALESNVGLNAIAQWVATLNHDIYHGLGLGNLYKKNVETPLSLVGEKLFYNPNKEWGLEFVS